MKKISLLLITISFLTAAPKTSVIFMIGDGMGPAYTSAYRYYKDDPKTPKVEPTVFDEMLVGMNTTYSENSLITDSAAAATALATGYKTKNGFIGATEKPHSQVKTLLEYAKEQGYITAMAVTSTLTHATPAGFISKEHHRDKEADIAKDFFPATAKEKLKFDFLMGGGEIHFNEAYGDINQTAKKHNVALYRNGYDFDSIHNYPFIAFTAYDYAKFAIDEKDENRDRVSKMTQKALSLVENKPFFMMIEGSQIDWCGHINDIACAMAEMDDFAKAVEKVKNYVDTHPDTLLIVTADHSTGGLAIGDKIGKSDKVSDEIRSRSYIWYKDVIKKVKASSITIAEALRTTKNIDKSFENYTGIDLTDKEYDQLASAMKKKDKKLCNAVNEIINQRSNTGWTTHGHTLVDVETFAYGKSSEKFRGLLDNTDIAKKLFKVLSAGK
ncbi:alkaline phosphatase [Sulfurovum sp. NBC37-1]|uniref:alkaline phosphatase n=1 Tax=Sulfurovum sp. (strain NBC37-1) TaxID=387093 RepID=UPI000158759C|nr:alkaline phosphatase [Sulfurovum sp. NBC37-1]BAF71503.1 alkaline phosphatase [Sulfurovum sp. NBC37-1]